MRLVPILRRLGVDQQGHRELNKGMRRVRHDLAHHLDCRLDLNDRHLDTRLSVERDNAKVRSQGDRMRTSLRGVNLAGGEWPYTAGQTPVEGQDYQWVSRQDIDYLVSKGVAFARLIFSWEILQPALNGSFDATYEATMRARVTYATGKGMNIMIEPHGGEFTRFARYKDRVVGSAAVPNSAFADLWRRLAELYQNNSRVILGLMNEPNAMSTMQWIAAAQAAIGAIRATGAANMIMVPGNGFSQPSSWNDTWYDTATMPKVSNATGWTTLVDPLNNTVVSVHTYFNVDGGGGADDIVDPNIIGQRLQPVVDWARARGLKVHLSEFGANAATAGAQAAVANALDYIDANTDVMIGWAWWTYGPPPWWGGYRFTLCPKNNYTVDDPKMAWLEPRFDGPSAQTMRPTSVDVQAPSESTYTSKKQVAAGDYADVPAGSYSLKVATRTTYSDEARFCVNVILENPSDMVDVDWEQMTIDLRGHTLQSSWNSTIVGSTGVVTVTPMAETRTVRARNKTSFGLCVLRNSGVSSKANYQVKVKALLW
jgi:endoglucanase